MWNQMFRETEAISSSHNSTDYVQITDEELSQKMIQKCGNTAGSNYGRGQNGTAYVYCNENSVYKYDPENGDWLQIPHSRLGSDGIDWQFDEENQV